MFCADTEYAHTSVQEMDTKSRIFRFSCWQPYTLLIAVYFVNVVYVHGGRVPTHFRLTKPKLDYLFPGPSIRRMKVIKTLSEPHVRRQLHGTERIIVWR